MSLGSNGGKGGLGGLGGGNAIVRHGASGALGALVKRGTDLTPADRERLSALAARGSQADDKRLERLTTSALSVQIASDFSDSTHELNETLRKLSVSLGSKIAEQYPSSRIGYGIFGGSGLIKSGEAARVLEKGHQGTDGWESSFGKFAAVYAENADVTRENVLISFHDARPRLNEELFSAIQKINTAGTVVYIVYVPSSGSTEDDRQVLKDLADPKSGFERGIFIDFSEVDSTDADIMEQVMAELVAAVAESNKEAAKSGDLAIAKGISNTNLLTRAAGIAEKARKLTAAKGGRKLLKKE